MSTEPSDRTASGLASTSRTRAAGSPSTAGTVVPEFAALEDVDLRAVWAHEALSFTPWLAEHLDMLADALGLGPLALVGREQAVGGFSVDIVARAEPGDIVVIENQLGQSDHDHLGKCITYAAGLGAKTVIWVLPVLRPEHRAALDWLNEHTDESVHFFGVQVRVVKIGDSKPAVVFEAVSRPNDWQKSTRSQAGSSAPSLGWQRLYDALALVPAGRWTTCQVLAKVVGTNAGWVGRHLYQRWDTPNLYRMLEPSGTPWKWFKWPDPNDARDVMDVLRKEGVPVVYGRADQSALLGADELLSLLGEEPASPL